MVWRPQQPRSIELAYYRDIKDVVDTQTRAWMKYANLLPSGDEREDASFNDEMARFFRAVWDEINPWFAIDAFSRRFADTQVFNWKMWRQQVKNKTRYELPETYPAREKGMADLYNEWVYTNTNRIKGFLEQRDAVLRDQVFQAVTTGRSRKQLIADILPSVTTLNQISGTNLSAYQRADLIATDQILTANAQLSELRMKNAGVVYYAWRGMDDGRERPQHVALNDFYFRIDRQPMKAADFKVVGKTGPATPGSEIAPGVPVRCRCYADADFRGSVFDFSEEDEK